MIFLHKTPSRLPGNNFNQISAKVTQSLNFKNDLLLYTNFTKKYTP